MPINKSQLTRIIECMDALMVRLDKLEELRAKNDAADEAEDVGIGTEADHIPTSDIMTAFGEHRSAPKQPFTDNVREEKSFPHRIHGGPQL